MKKLFFLLALAAMITPVFTLAQSETRTLSVRGSYNGIAVGGSHTVDFTIGPAGQPVTVTGEAEDLDNLEIYVKDKTLHIKFRKGYTSKTGSRVNVSVQNPELKEASVGGSGLLNITGGMKADNTGLSVGGSGTICADRVEGKRAEFNIGGSGKVICRNVDVEKAEASVGGSGHIEIGGKADKMEATVGGSGSVDARELTVASAEITVAGSGTVYTHCTRKISATVTGSGRVYYSGDPSTVSHRGKGKNFIKL